MTADDREIEFGEIEATPHQRRLRPDCNRQYRVAACGLPAGDDLPIFVDLDALGDIEAHALSNTRVELGGVMLGGQYEDEQGRPFVLIADTLRARHYESTAGSFKFTHETWAEFTRQRADRPGDLQIVGWYHTHPNMGVFLSEMDRFICEHFFGRPGDVALVIDPCQGQRGFFQWAAETPDRTKRTRGFYVFASRHRELELMSFAAYVEGKIMGANDPRFGAMPFAGVPYPGSPAPYTDPRNAWLGPAVLGMLFIQFLLLALLAWKSLLPEAIAPAGASPARERTAAVSAGSDASDAGDRASREAKIQLQLLDRIVDQLGQGTPRGLVPLLEQLQQENEHMKADARVYRALEAKVRADNETLSQSLAAREKDKSELTRQVARLQETVRQNDEDLAEYQRQIASLNEQLASAAPAAAGTFDDWIRQPKVLSLVGIGILVAGVLAWAAWTVGKRRRETATAAESGPG